MISTVSVLPAERRGRQARDRLEVLTTLLHGPDVDPIFRDELIRFPPDHPTYQWRCHVIGCERPISKSGEWCSVHAPQWTARPPGTTKAVFVHTATGLEAGQRPEGSCCRVCPQRPASSIELQMCERHYARWVRRGRREFGGDLDGWLATQEPFPGYGHCQTLACGELADSPIGLCRRHRARYQRDGRPGQAALPPSWGRYFEDHGIVAPVDYGDEAAFRRWCAETPPLLRPGQLNLHRLPPMLRAELQWGLWRHTQGERSVWQLYWVQSLVDSLRAARVGSLTEVDTAACTHLGRMIVQEISAELRLAYYAPADTREAGFIETDHFGVRFPGSRSHFDLTGISQRWLRDMLWDYMATRLRCADPPRSRGVFDNLRRAVVELSAFLDAEAVHGGRDPQALGEADMLGFVADQRRRARDGMPARGIHRADGEASTVTDLTRRLVFNHARQVLRWALDCGDIDRLGVDRGFVVALPAGGRDLKRARSPFPDDVASALADEDNLRRLTELYDPNDHGLRDIWETIIVTGRRASEVIQVRWECLGRYTGLAMFWHDQTKVGNYDQAIRIPEWLYERLRQRQDKTVAWFANRHGRSPSAQERAVMALFPRPSRNPDGALPRSYGWFQTGFRAWVDGLDLPGHYVAHQARHTLATRLLRHGASLTHIRRYLGQVSDRMAEHYAHVAASDLEDALQHIWVAGPGSAAPGRLLTDPHRAMTRSEAVALAIDLSRRSTPTEGGICTYQPVVDGGRCPWKLDCHNCDKFVLSGADLLYWRRKREQWYSLAERAPDDATAAYLHDAFAPTAAAIDGLEAALAGMGLLDDALALDLRRPQDYFARVWSIGFRAEDLARAPNHPDDDPDAPHDPDRPADTARRPRRLEQPA